MLPLAPLQYVRCQLVHTSVHRLVQLPFGYFLLQPLYRHVHEATLYLASSSQRIGGCCVFSCSESAVVVYMYSLALYRQWLCTLSQCIGGGCVLCQCISGGCVLSIVVHRWWWCTLLQCIGSGCVVSVRLSISAVVVYSLAVYITFYTPRAERKWPT